MVLHPTIFSILSPPSPLFKKQLTTKLWNADDIQTLYARTNLYYNSFFPSKIKAWNSLPEDIKQSSILVLDLNAAH